MLETYLSACLVGLLTETIARTGRLWIYRKPITPVINILIMFGLVMGGLSLVVPTLGHGPVQATPSMGNGKIGSRGRSSTLIVGDRLSPRTNTILTPPGPICAVSSYRIASSTRNTSQTRNSTASPGRALAAATRCYMRTFEARRRSITAAATERSQLRWLRTALSMCTV